jgi:hypothetical protein
MISSWDKNYTTTFVLTPTYSSSTTRTPPPLPTVEMLGFGLYNMDMYHWNHRHVSILLQFFFLVISILNIGGPTKTFFLLGLLGHHHHHYHHHHDQQEGLT